MNEAQILELIKRREERGMEMALDMYQIEMNRVALRILGSKELALDVVQEAFISLWQKADQIKKAESLRYWLKRNVSYKAIDLIRKTRPEVLDENAVIGDVDVHENVDLKHAISKLSSFHQKLVTLFYIEGFTAKELASSLNKSESTIKTHLRRALSYLFKAMQGENK